MTHQLIDAFTEPQSRQKCRGLMVCAFLEPIEDAHQATVLFSLAVELLLEILHPCHAFLRDIIQTLGAVLLAACADRPLAIALKNDSQPLYKRAPHSGKIYFRLLLATPSARILRQKCSPCFLWSIAGIIVADTARRGGTGCVRTSPHLVRLLFIHGGARCLGGRRTVPME